MLGCNSGIFDQYRKHEEASRKNNAVFFFADTLMRFGISDPQTRRDIQDHYGKWHIDHIQPLANFDLTNIEQLKIACNYNNLQPLWASDNLSKNKY